MAAFISKLQMMLNSAQGNGHDGQLDRDLTVGRSFCRRTAERINIRLQTVLSNQDDQILRTADAVLGWDRPPRRE